MLINFRDNGMFYKVTKTKMRCKICRLKHLVLGHRPQRENNSPTEWETRGISRCKCKASWVDAMPTSANAQLPLCA